MDNNLYLVYVKPFCKNNDNTYEYDLFFSDTPDVVWGLDWEVTVPNSLDDLTPEKSTYQKIIRIKSPLPFKTIEEISCYSMEYAIKGIVALSWVDIDGLEEFPESRVVLHFRDEIEKVKNVLQELKISLEY